MKWLPLLLSLSVHVASAKGPGHAAIDSCLAGHAISSASHVKELRTNEIIETDDDRSGCDALFHFKAAGREIGYAKKRTQHAIIYHGRILLIDRATVLAGTHIEASDLDTYSAGWRWT